MNPSACPACGAAATSAGGDGLCPGCLLGGVLARGEMADDPGEEGSFPERIGPYRLERLLGRGGTGVVFLARQDGMERPMALKMPASAQFAGPDEIRRLRLEADSIAALEHPHIVPLHAVGEHEGRPYFVMKYAAGGTLADAIRRRLSGEPAKEQIRADVAALAAIARAVQFAHERGVLHRDLKPANLLLDENGRPMVGDFGLARLLHAPSGTTMTGSALGTPAYMAPEQAAGRDVTTAADIYGLGAVLFHLLAGRPPFGTSTPLDTLRRVVAEDAPEVRAGAPWLDRDLATIVAKCLQRDPAKRYRSAAALADDLDRWLAGEPVTARPAGLPERLWKWARRRPVAATFAASGMLAGLIFVALLAAGAVLLREERNHALEQEAIARRRAIEARNAGESLRLHAYAADVYLASRAFHDGHLGVARRMLARHVPKPGESDLRGFEWHAFQELCRGDEAAVWGDHRAAVAAVAIDASGKHLATGGRDGRVIVRTIPEGKELLRLPRADAPAGAAEIPLMTAVAARSRELSALLLAGGINPAEVRMRGRPSKLGEITTLSWSPDGTRLVVGGEGGFIRVFAMPEGRLEGLIPLTQARQVFHSPEGSRIIVTRRDLTAARKDEVRIYRADDLSLLRALDRVEPAAAISADGKWLAVMPRGGSRIELQDPDSGAVLHSWEAGVTVDLLAFSADGTRLFGKDYDGRLVTGWQVADGRRLGNFIPPDGLFRDFVLSADGRTLAAAGSGQAVFVCDARTFEPLPALRGHEDGIHALAFSPDGAALVTGGNDHSARLWKTRSPGPGALPVASAPPADGPTIRAPCEAGEWTGTGARHLPLTLRDRASGAEIRRIPGPPNLYLRLVASPDGSLLAAFSWPREIRVARPPTAGWSEPWYLSEGTVGPIVFSPDSRRLASGGDDNAVTIRDTAGGKVLAVLRGHREQVRALAFTPDGRTLASSSADGTLRLWHLPTWRELGALAAGEEFVDLAFSVDGRRLAATRRDGRVREFSAGNR